MNLRLFALLAALVLVGASCQSPLTTQATLGTFSLVSNSPQLKLGEGRTTLPTAPEFHYTVALTGTATLNFDNLTGLGTFQAPVGDYSLQVTLFNSSNEVIGLSAAQSITVGTSAASNAFTVVVVPQSGGTGSVAMTYSWPDFGDDGTTTLVDDAEFELRDLEDAGAPVDLTGLESIDVLNQSASVTGDLPSGTYLLTLRLSKTEGTETYYHPTVSDVIRVYDNLESARTFALTTADLQKRPSSPTVVNASFVGSSFNVSWLANPGTHAGFRVYRNGVAVTTVGPGETSAILNVPPTEYSEAFKVSAYNTFGESDGVSATPVTIPQLTPVVGYDLKVGYSTTSATTTTMHLSWTNPANDPVTLYRASALSGPYSVLATSSGNTHVDDQSQGLVPGTTYYYAIATKGGYLLNLPTSNLLSSTGPVVHTDPVAGVVSGTTLAWDSASQSSVPVVGVSYLVPDTTQLPALENGDYWVGPELPTVAFLAGGYTYWVWGKTYMNDTRFVMGAFDSSGVLKETYDGSARYISALAVVGNDLEVTRQDGTTLIPWAEVDWFQPADYAIVVDFQTPLAPVITFQTGGAVNGVTLDGSWGIYQTLQVDPQLQFVSGFSLLDWTIDGFPGYPNEQPLSVDGQGVLTIQSQYLDPGVHEVLLRITDGVHIYSANFNVTVVRVDVSS